MTACGSGICVSSGSSCGDSWVEKMIQKTNKEHFIIILSSTGHSKDFWALKIKHIFKILKKLEE